MTPAYIMMGGDEGWMGNITNICYKSVYMANLTLHPMCGSV